MHCHRNLRESGQDERHGIGNLFRLIALGVGVLIACLSDAPAVVFVALTSAPASALAESAQPKDVTPLVMSVIEKLAKGNLDDPGFVAKTVRATLNESLFDSTDPSSRRAFTEEKAYGEIDVIYVRFKGDNCFRSFHIQAEISFSSSGIYYVIYKEEMLRYFSNHYNISESLFFPPDEIFDARRSSNFYLTVSLTEPDFRSGFRSPVAPSMVRADSVDLDLSYSCSVSRGVH